MALTKKLTSAIKQTSDSCLMISYSIILNYYSDLTADQIFESFLNTKEDLFIKYQIDRDLSKGMSLECQYVYLYSCVLKASNYTEQFSNEYIKDALSPLAQRYSVNTKMVDIKREVSELKETLVSEEACLSLSCEVPKDGGFQWHATPIAYDKEFYTVVNGSFISLGQDFMTIKEVFQARDIGDGILFNRPQ